jgi:hypothetical protein
VVTGVAAATPIPAAERAAGPPRGKTTVSFGIGLGAGEAQSGAALRVGVDWILTGRLRLELVGSYLDRGLDSDAWNGYLGLRLDLEGKGASVVPYFALGGGFFRARFGMVGFGPSAAVDGACGVARECSTNMPTYADMPAFYRRRLQAPPYGARWPDPRTFTDPMVAVGGGVRCDVTPRLFVIPDVRALLVTGDGDTLAVGVLTLNVGYRF